MVNLSVDENTGIMYRQWKAEDPKAVFLLVHGLSASTERWEAFGEFFAGNSISSYAIELKGFGNTKGPRGYIESLDSYIKSIMNLYDIIIEEHPSKRVFLIGESMGALISFIMAESRADIFNGLVCISPAFASKLKFSFGFYVSMFFAFFFRPRKYFLMPFNPAMCTRDEEYRKVMDVSSVEGRLVTANLLTELFFAQIKARLIRRRVKLPALFLIAGSDSMVDSKLSEEIFRDMGSTDKDMILYPEMYHSLSVELGKEKVFGDILSWVLKRV